MEEKIELVATCLFGLEKFLGEEITSLGYERLETMEVWWQQSISFSDFFPAVLRSPCTEMLRQTNALGSVFK